MHYAGSFAGVLVRKHFTLVTEPGFKLISDGDRSCNPSGIPEELKKFFNKMSDFEGIETDQEEDFAQEAQSSTLDFDPNNFEDALKKVLNIGDERNDSCDESSGDEEDLESDEGLEAEDLEEYDSHMKAELSRSKVFQDETEGKIENLDDVDKPIDVDAKVLKNLLESFHSQGDLAGPTTTLLKPLGIDLETDNL